MDLNNVSVFNLANKNLQYLAERQRVLAENIANANTPGYLPKDVKKPDFAEDFKSKLALNTTNSNHMAVMPRKQNLVVYTPKIDEPLTIDGNGVVIEEQLNEAHKTSSEYGRVLAIYSKYRDMIKVANTKING